MSNKYIKLENLAYYNGKIKEYINNNIGAGNGVAIYDDYSHFPSTQGEEIVVCAKNNYFDANNNLYSSGFYYWDISNSIYVKIDEFWGGILGKPFEDIEFSHFEIDGNGKLKIQQTILDDLQIRLDNLDLAMANLATIDDASNSSVTSTWSIDKIKEELDKISVTTGNHSHNNMDILNDFTDATGTGELAYNGSLVMFKDVYDANGDGVVEKSKEAQGLVGVTATTDEFNYLKGLTGNIQDQLNSVVSGVSFKGEFPTYTDMLAFFNSSNPPKHGYWVYIQIDETHNSQENVQYVYDGTNWVYGGGRTIVNNATTSTKGVIQLGGDLTGTAIAPELIDVITPSTIGYIKSIKIDSKGRVISITEDGTLVQRLADLESRPRIHVGTTSPTNIKHGDIWIEG